MVEQNEMKNGKISSDKEIKYIEIGKYLKKYETNLEYIFREKNYCKIIMDGRDIIELMLEISLTGEKNLPSEPITIKQAIKSDIAIKAKNALFEIDGIISEINKENVNYKKTYRFLKSFKKFLVWFRSTDDEPPKLNLNNCIELIDNLPNTEPSKDNREEENDHINKINESLKNLEEYLKLVSKENYAGAVIEGYNVCNLMLELSLKNEGYAVDNGLVIWDGKRIPLIPFCTQESLLPKECLAFLNTIEEYKNNFLKLSNSYKLALSFLEGLSYFMLWFDNFYSNRYSIDKPFKIENCYAEIDKLTRTQNEDTVIFKSISSKTKKQKSEILDYNVNGLQINNRGNFSLDQKEFLENMMKGFAENITNNLSKKIDNSTEKIIKTLKEEIKNISLKITDYQSLIERQIKHFDSDEEKDKLIAAFADECAERIISETHFESEEDSYNSEKDNLIKSLGREAWTKLSEESQTYLISSKLMFDNLNSITNVDYSGVCILVTKTLEVELYKRFFDDFKQYLNQKKYNYKNYPTGLLHKNRWLLDDDKFNLGTVAYILCLKEPNDYYLAKNNKEKLIEYCEADLFKKRETEEIDSLIKKFGKDIEDIREKYRNPSAHRENIDHDKAEECLDLVLYNKKSPLLKEMLDSFIK